MKSRIDALGVDEHVWTHTGFPGTGMVTGIIDHTRDEHGNVHARLLDLVPGRSGKAYGDWLKAQGPAFTQGIRVATVNPFRGYANAIRDELPEAITVVDAFHIVRLGMAMVDDVRRRVQQDTLGYRGRKDDPLFSIRRTVQQGIESLTDRQVARLEKKLEAGDPNSEVTIAWHSYQKLRAVYHARPERGRELVAEILSSFPTCPIPEIAKLGRSLRAWKAAIMAYFENYRIRNLLAAGGHRPYRKKSPNHA